MIQKSRGEDKEENGRGARRRMRMEVVEISVWRRTRRREEDEGKRDGVVKGG